MYFTDSLKFVLSQCRASNRLRLFAQEHPAFLLAVSLLVGVNTVLFWQFPWNILFFSTWVGFLFLIKKGHFIAPALVIGSCTWLLYRSAPLIPQETPRKGIFCPQSMQPHRSPFQEAILYKGTLAIEEGIFPCTIYMQMQHRMQADSIYLVEGMLSSQGAYQYILKLRHAQPIHKTYNFIEKRYLWKKKFYRFLKTCLSEESAAFFYSFLTGHPTERLLRYEFQKLGLQHILAISGFHFGLLIQSVSFILAVFLSARKKAMVLLFVANGYFLFVGNLVAVERSWMMALLYLGARLLHKTPSPLNILGVAMSLEIACHPLIVQDVAFQLSFSSCAGIFLLYPVLEKKLQSILPKRSSKEFEALSLISKCFAPLSSFLRQSLSLNVSVTMALFPLLLHHFHQIPLLSLFYNLFFPLLITLVTILFFISIGAFILFPIWAEFFFQFTDKTLQTILSFTKYPPSNLDFYLMVPSVPDPWLPVYMVCLFGAAIFLNDLKTSSAFELRKSQIFQ